MSSIELLKKFLTYVKPYWFLESILFILMVLTSAGSLVSPYILKVLIDKVFPSGDFNYLMQVLAILVGINIARIIISYFTDYFFSWVSNHIARDMRIDLFNHLIKLPISFYDKNKTGDIIHRLNSEVNTVQNMISGTLIRFIKNFLTIIGLVVALTLLNWKLFLISIIFTPFIFINTIYFQPRIHKIIKLTRIKGADLLSFLIERFENVKLIKNFNRYEFEENKLNSKIQDLINLNLKNVRQTSGTQKITSFFVTLSPILIFIWGGKEVMTGTVTLGSLIAFIQYLNRLFNPMRDIMNLYWGLVRSSVSMERLFEFMKIKPEMHESNHLIYESKNIKRIKSIESITFRNVCFKYEENWILNNLNIVFEKGKKYSLVGASGCGKSSIMNLLNQFYIPQNGEILINNTEIKQFYNLRNKILLLTQDNQLFHDSIWENIKYGEPQSSKEEIIKAAKLIGIFDHINSLENRFESKIGDKGTKLSGGQKQRIAIARALLRKAEVIILDEATSALDSESENQIYLTLSKLYKEKILIMISHRLSTIKNVDEILFMEKGKIAERGSYTNLIKKKGLFWALFKDQIDF